MSYAGRSTLNPAEIELARWLSSAAGRDVLDRVFAESARLDSDEIVVYVRALADVARAELWARDGGAKYQVRSIYTNVFHPPLGFKI